MKPPVDSLNGKSFPMTVITPLSAWKRVVLWITLQGFRFAVLKDVDKLRFIHFAHWSVVDRLSFAKATPRDAPERHHFLFVTNYNGPWDQYIDAFSLVPWVRLGINRLWWSSLGFPSAWPVRTFKRYIRYFEYPVDAYYNAYPGASIRDVNSALALHRKLQGLAKSAPDGDDEKTRTLIAKFDAVNAEHLGGTGRRHAPSAVNASPGDLQL